MSPVTTSHNGCNARADTDFVHNQARASDAHFANSSKRVLVLTMMFMLCIMFVMGGGLAL